MPRFSGQFCKKKWMRQGGFFFPEVFFLFSKNFIKSTTAAIVTSIKDDLLYIIKQFKWNVLSKSSNCLSHVAWHNHWIVLNLGSTDSSWNGAFVIFFREGTSIWSRLSILYGVIQFCERTWRWKVEDNSSKLYSNEQFGKK